MTNVKPQDEITMPTPLWEALNDISGRLGSLDAKVDILGEGQKKAVEYQRVQNGNLAKALAEIAHVREIAATTATATAASAAAAASAASVAATAAGEISALKQAAAVSQGERKGISLAWGVVVVVGGLLLSNGLMLYHILSSS